MQINTEFTGSFKDLSKREKVILTVEDGINLSDFLTFLAEKYGKRFREYVYNPDEGRLEEMAVILLNNRPIGPQNLDKTQLKEGDTVTISPPLC